MAEIFPRLLVATEFSPDAAGGGPAVVRQMLRGWPAEKLFWWSCRTEADVPSAHPVAGHAVARIPQKLYPNRRWRHQKLWLLENLWTPWAARHFRQTLEQFQPEVIWVIPHGWSIAPLARELLRADRPFHVSIHDYPEARGTADRYDAALGQRLAGRVDQLYARANTRDAICQPMVEDLQNRTGATGIVNRAGLEPEEFAQLSSMTSVAGDHIRIGYAGTIIVEKEFALWVAALANIRRQLPRPVELEFFGNHSYRSRAWFDGAWMTEHGNLPLAELNSALRQCTWGFAPMALTDDDPRYNRFSLPTKFASYAAAGLPILTLGHPESSVVKLAEAYDVGACSTATDLETLSQQLLIALAEPNPRQKYLANLQRCARAEFDANHMREVLHGCLKRIAIH